MTMFALSRSGIILLALHHPVAFSQTVAPYNCDFGYDTWKTTWTPGWKAWCCLNHHRGCEATLTDTSTTETGTSSSTSMTSSTATSSTKTASTGTTTTVTSATDTRTSTTETRTSTISPEEACKVECHQGGNTATCAERLMWVSAHVTQNEANVCAAAQVLVVTDCPEECGDCTPVGSGCESASDFGMVMKRYDDAPLQEIGAEHLTSRRAMLAVACSISLAGVAMIVSGFARSRRAERAIYTDLLVEDGHLARHA